MIDGMRTTRVLAALAAASFAAGCAAGPAAGEPAPPALNWSDCGTGLDCATLEVPVDHADPAGPTLPLALVRHRATDPAQRIGSLLVNPGGPGAAAGDLVRGITSAPDGAGPYSPELLTRFDVVGMDPRGVGASAGVRCLTDAEREEDLALDRDPELPGMAPREVLLAEAAELADGCAAGVDPLLLENLATDDVARDMDLVRAALGEERISYLGQSYGTLLGATYATLFPDHVRQMVLDAPVDPTTWQTDTLDATLDQAVSAERVLDSWFATCRAESCGFGGGDPEGAFDALVARLEATPLEVPASGAVPAQRVDGGAILLAARTAVFAPQLWPVLTRALVAAEAGDGSVVAALGSVLTRNPDGTPNGLGEANVAVNCLDRDVPADLAEHDRNAAEAVAAAPRFGELSGYISLVCADWPAANPDRFTGPYTGAGAPPVLVVGGREDSQTPFDWSEAMTAELEGSVLLTREGVGHGSYRAGAPCVDAAVDRLLVDGTLPAPGTTCPGAPTTTVAPG